MSSDFESNGSKSKKPIPKKLETDLQNIPKFRDGNYHHHQSIPKTTIVSDLLNDSLERAMYDEIIGPVLHTRSSTGSNDNHPKTKYPMLQSTSGTMSRSGSRILSKDEILPLSTKSNPPSNDFNNTILRRLEQVEKELKLLRTEYSIKVKKCNELEDENYELREKFTNQNSIFAEMKLVRRKNELLRKQIQEMEEFLSDYGLVWIGNNVDKSNEDIELNDDTIEYAIFAKKVLELNEIIASEPTQVIVNENRQARLVNPQEIREKIKLSFYQNGILVKRGPFRYKSSENYKRFISDIMDGYFPSEFKGMYPDGVIFELTDKHEENYNEEEYNRVNSMAVSKLLHNLPKSVIKNGEVVNIRDEIATRIYGVDSIIPPNHVIPLPLNEKNSVNNLEVVDKSTFISEELGKVTPRLISPSISHEHKRKDSEENSIPVIVNILIKWIDGKQFKGKYLQEDSIVLLKDQLITYMSSILLTPCPSFVFKTVYPQKLTLTNDMTFFEAGLSPNGTIYATKI